MGVFFSLRQRNGGVQRRCRPAVEVLEHRCLLAGGFGVANLVSDLPGLARTTDPNVVNPWGIALSPTGPFWLADNGSGGSGIFDGAGGPFALVVTVPRGSAPTGVAFNSGPGFAVTENGISAPSRFLYVTEAGTIAGWSAVVDPTRAVLAVDQSASGAVYTGVALATDSAGRRFLYAADFSHRAIDVFDQQFHPVRFPGSFRDPALPDGFAPFNVANIDNLLYVTYAEQDANGHDDVSGAGHGYIDVYNADGSLLRRFASQGPLDSPWGLALAPPSFGAFGGALLIGNNGDGHISAFDQHSGAFLGQLTGDGGAPIAIPYLWSLTFGNGHLGGDSATLFFAAGVDDGTHGLFGAIQSPARRGTDTAGSGTFDPQAPGEPGDYPLPPRAGPGLSPDSAVRANPVVDFLPLARSSLVLVPTLSAAPMSMRFDAPTDTAMPDGAAFPFIDADTQSVGGINGHVIALSGLLDLSALRGDSTTRGEQRPEPSPRVIAVRSIPALDRNAARRTFPADGDLAAPAADVREQQAPPVLAPDDLDSALLSPAFAGAAEPMAIGANQPEQVKPQNGGACTWLISLLVLLTSPAAWVCWARRESRMGWSRWGFSREPVRRLHRQVVDARVGRAADWHSVQARDPAAAVRRT